MTGPGILGNAYAVCDVPPERHELTLSLQYRHGGTWKTAEAIATSAPAPLVASPGWAPAPRIHPGGSGLGRPGGAAFWADFVYALRSVGYDGTLNIEHEETLVNSVEGVGRAARLLKQIVSRRASGLDTGEHLTGLACGSAGATATGGRAPDPISACEIPRRRRVRCR